MRTSKIDNSKLSVLLDEGRSTTEIMQIMNISRSTLGRYIKKLGKNKFDSSPLEFGAIFGNGNIQILEQIAGRYEKGNGSIRQVYKVKCLRCNNISEMLRSNIVRKGNKFCKFCAEQGTGHINWKGYEEINGALLYEYQYGAKNRGLSFNISIQDMWNLFLRQNHKCALSGIELTFDPNVKWTDKKITASLDRIDSSRGYELDNIQWIHQDLQRIKMNMEQVEFLDWCKKVADYQNGLVNYNNDEALIEWQHHKNWRGYGNIRSTLFSSWKSGALSRKLIWQIELQDIWDLFVRQRGLCALSGLRIDFNRNWRDFTNRTASLDRIDSAQGYIIDNLQWSHKKLNIMKLDFDNQEFIKWCCEIAKCNFGVY